MSQNFEILVTEIINIGEGDGKRGVKRRRISENASQSTSKPRVKEIEIREEENNESIMLEDRRTSEAENNQITFLDGQKLSAFKLKEYRSVCIRELDTTISL
uniref:Uncharacterized protein n=1 Tax=Strongyloides papillosus TaxID=174720 RepID=A0A0N5C4F6_STREA